jgi:hypothetical protein
MNGFALPTDAVPQIASSTTSMMAAVALPTEFALGIIIGLFVIQVLFDAVAERLWPQSAV